MLDPSVLLALGFSLSAFVFAGLSLNRWSRPAAVADVALAAGVGGLTLLYAVLAPGYGPRRVLVAILGLSWSFRLAMSLVRDHGLHRQKGKRVLDLSAGSGQKQFTQFVVQAILTTMLSLPILVVMANPVSSLTTADVLGGSLAMMVLGMRALVDGQLARWRDVSPALMHDARVGAWRWSRHPDLLCDILFWIAVVPMGLVAPMGSWVFLGAPVFVYILLRPSGIWALEESLLAERGDEYRKYVRSTPRLLPSWGKKDCA